MARTTYEFPLKSQNMMNDIHAYLTSQGFQYVSFKGENVYRKNVDMFSFLSFIMQPPTCNLSFQVIGKSVIMEAWILQAGAFGKEVSMDDFTVTRGPSAKNFRAFYNDITNYIERY